VIDQVEGEFRMHKFSITLSKTTINLYMRLNMIGTFPLVQGYGGLLPPHVVKFLVLAAELYMQINQVKCVIIPWQKIIMIMRVNKDTLGKCILLKVDSSTGCNGGDLLNKCQFRGVYIYPSLPNATSVKQETDINYGSFKGIL
jgi:hypothetical protein